MPTCPTQTQVQVLPFKVPYHSILASLLTSFETAPALGRGCKPRGGRISRRLVTNIREHGCHLLFMVTEASEKGHWTTVSGLQGRGYALLQKVRKKVPTHNVWASYLDIWRTSVESSNCYHNVCTSKQINKSVF